MPAAVPGPDVAGIETCLQHGQAAMAEGRARDGIEWFERAWRLGRRVIAVRYLLASALAGHDDARALALFEGLIEEEPEFREARLGRIGALLRQGDARAAGSMAEYLAGTALVAGAEVRAMVGRVAGAAGAPGWASMTAAGEVLVWRRPGGRSGPVELRLDGRAVRLSLSAGPDGVAMGRLPPGWPRIREAAVTAGDRPLLGSPLRPSALLRTEGGVAAGRRGGLSGWAWLPADPDTPPRLVLVQAGRRTRLDATGDAALEGPRPDHFRPRGFRVLAGDLAPDEPVRVLGADGRDLLGSPWHPGEAAVAAATVRALAQALPAAGRPAPVQGGTGACQPVLAPRWEDAPRDLAAVRAVPAAPAALAVDVAIPVYRGAADLRACLRSLHGTLPPGGRVVIVEDGSPDPALLAVMAAAEADGAATVLRHRRNRGFPAAANTALRHAARAGRDVVLLNPDTLVPPGWLGRLRDAAYAAPDIGSATPLSNEATILSYPHAAGGNPAPRGAALAEMDALCRAANPGGRVALPTGIGFCLYVRHDCLAAVGLFREDAFAQGYGEENDWCLRAGHLGWRHVAALDVFVAHLGGRSFGPGRQHLMRRNGAVLNRLHPGYDALVQGFVAADPLQAARRRIDAARWAAAAGAGGAAVLVTHGLGGGVDRFVGERCAALRRLGLRPVVLVPDRDGPADARGACRGVRVQDGAADGYPNLCFALPGDAAALESLLAGDRVRHVELHHMLGHPAEVAGLAGRLGVPYDCYVHDAALFCPRTTLCGRSGQYCGEPVDVQTCEDCIADLGSLLTRTGSVRTLREDSRRLLAGARRVVVPCEDVARRVRRHAPGVVPSVRPWQPDDPPGTDRRQERADGPVRVCVVGGINRDKGYDVLLACARDARRRNLPLRFRVVGHTADDDRLMETGTAFVTGPYAEEEGSALLAAQAPDLGFVPSVCPETWCYGLTLLWDAGLDVLAFDLGAQAERIRRTGRGRLLPLGLAADRVNDHLLQAAGWAVPGGTEARRRMGVADA